MTNKKISNFPVSTTIPAGSLIDFVYNGVNYSITDANFYAALGVTGTMSQAGDPTTVPILDVAGSDYKIRNGEAGPGIKLSVSDQGGITIEHNFSQDTTQLPLVTDITADSPVFPSFEASTGIAIVKDGHVFKFSATGALPATKAVAVNSLSDFPAASGGVITLLAGYAYVISNDVLSASRFVCADGSAVVGYGAFGPKLTYTGVGIMFTCEDADFEISSLHFDCPNGTIFDWSETGAGNTKQFWMLNSICDSCQNVGTLDNGLLANINTVEMNNVAVQGMVIAGTDWPLVSFDRYATGSTNVGFIGVDLGSCTAQGIELSDFFMSGPVGSVALAGLTASDNVLTGGEAVLSGANVSGGMVISTTIDPVNDIRWKSTDNVSIPDTRPDAYMTIEGNALKTPITTTGELVKMVGVWVPDLESKFSIDSTGTITYLGESDYKTPIDFSMSVLMESGGDKVVGAQIHINGAPVGVKKTGTASSSKPSSLTVPHQAILSEGDEIELWLSNEQSGSTLDVIGQAGIGRVA